MAWSGQKSRLAKAFSLGGVILNGKSSSARVSTGVRTYTLMLGESIFVETTQGAKSVCLERVDAGSAWIDLDGEKVKLVKAPAL